MSYAGQDFPWDIARVLEKEPVDVDVSGKTGRIKGKALCSGKISAVYFNGTRAKAFLAANYIFM